MVQIAPVSLPHIQAALNYLATMSAKPVTYAYQPPPGVPWSTAEADEHTTVIHNLRPAASELLLDDVGFQFLTYASAVKNFWDEDEIKRVYYPESDRPLEARDRRERSARLRPHAEAPRVGRERPLVQAWRRPPAGEPRSSPQCVYN